MHQINRTDPTPLYLQVEALLRSQVESGELAPHAAIPDERSLAAQLGLSRMTVRRAIQDLTREGMFDRVRGRGTFVRPLAPAAQPVVRIAPRKAAVISPCDLAGVQESVFYFNILQGIEHVMRTSGVALAFQSMPAELDAFLERMKSESDLDGLLIMGVLDQAFLHALTGLAQAVVLVDSAQPAGGVRFDQVSVGGEDASYEAVSSLLRLGHRDIGLMVHAPLTPAGRNRQAGYERALRERGVPIREDRIIPTPCNSQAAYEIMQRMLASRGAPTALFCTTCEMAIGVLAAIKDHGWRVPEHMSLISFGEPGLFTSPALSMVRIPAREMGMEAARLLCDRFNQPQAPAQRRILESQWTPKGSCGSPRKGSDAANGRA